MSRTLVKLENTQQTYNEMHSVWYLWLFCCDVPPDLGRPWIRKSHFWKLKYVLTVQWEQLSGTFELLWTVAHNLFAPNEWVSCSLLDPEESKVPLSRCAETQNGTARAIYKLPSPLCCAYCFKLVCGVNHSNVSVGPENGRFGTECAWLLWRPLRLWLRDRGRAHSIANCSFSRTCRQVIYGSCSYIQN
jgi:hypothetical protein